MASLKDNRKNKKEDKPGLAKRIVRFFSDIKAELKRVTWPDKKRLKSNAGIVMAIILSSALLVFIFDTAITSFLSATGFYSYDTKAHSTVTEPATEETGKAPVTTDLAENKTEAGDAGTESSEPAEITETTKASE